jgi:hypothetical protein
MRRQELKYTYEHKHYSEKKGTSGPVAGYLPDAAIMSHFILARSEEIGSSMSLRKPYLGLLQRRQCMVPTARGWLVLLLAATALVLFAARNLHSFLAVTDPVNAEILVVEAWLPDYALEEVVVEFKRKAYSRLYLTGGPVEVGFYLSEYKNYPSLAAATLTKLGVKKEVIQEVPVPDMPQDRTYAAALALKLWFHEHGISPGALQVVSLGPHARRTRLLFAKALGDDFTVGITAIQGKGYHPDSWWATSAGVRSVISETIAYSYARLFFRSG